MKLTKVFKDAALVIGPEGDVNVANKLGAYLGSKKWKPANGQKYWYITMGNAGGICTEWLYYDERDNWHAANIRNGNCYPNRKTAVAIKNFFKKILTVPVVTK